MKQQLIDAIHILANELVRNGKRKTADYFSHVESRIMCMCEENREELRDVLDQLKKSGSMIQYANFNVKEEHLWDEVSRLAQEWSNAIS